MSDNKKTKTWIFKDFIKQNFSIPSGIIHYISTTPTSSNGYKKLQQTCKYFYFKKQLIVFDHFKWSAMQQACRNHEYFIDWENSNYKIWLTKDLIIHGQNSEDFITTLMPRIYQSNIYNLSLCYHDISYRDYKILVEAGNVEQITINDAMIVRENGKFVPLENILELLPNLFCIICTFEKNNEYIYTSETAQKLTELPRFLSLKRFVVYGLSELFNPRHFCNFVKNHESASYFFNFCPIVSDESYDKFIAALEDASIICETENNNISIEKRVLT